MKFLVLIFLLLQNSIYACTLCTADVPQVLVDTEIKYDSKKTFFDIKWKFHEKFVSSLTQYDLNENNTFDKDEQLLIEESLLTYLENLHYLTDIEYKSINNQEQSEYIQNIEPSFLKLDFKDNAMTLHYKFSLPFILSNKNKLFIAFNDENDNFRFTLKNIVLNNYPHGYSLQKKIVESSIIFNDSTLVSTQSSLSIPKAKKTLIYEEKEPIQTPTYIEVLSEKLSQIKENLQLLLKDIKENNTLSSYIWLLLFSFLYGIVHAIGPGHGKSLVGSYFISQDKSYTKAFIVSCLIGIVHTFSAFLLTLIVYNSIGFIFNSTLINIEQIATKISATIIIMIALYLLYKKVKKTKQNFVFTQAPEQSFVASATNTKHTQTLSCACNGCKTTSTDLSIILAAGIIPCPGTVTIFIFTMSLGIYFIGFLSALFMSAGMSLIIFITAIISVKLRKSTNQNTTIIKILEYGSLVFIFMLGLFLLFSN